MSTVTGINPELVEPFCLNGRGWWSPELSALRVAFGDGLLRQACEALELDARRQNVPALREWLEGQEDRLK